MMRLKISQVKQFSLTSSFFVDWPVILKPIERSEVFVNYVLYVLLFDV